MSNITWDFTDKVVIVTGGASGIGKATVEAFAEAGAYVVLVDTNSTKAQEVVEQFHDDQILFVKGDVGEPETAALAVQAALVKNGEIDILVNNAGVEYNGCGNIITMPIETMMRIFQVNLFGYIYMLRACVPHMKFGGRVVQVSSLQGMAAALPGTSYQASKGAIIALTKSLAIEYAEKGITVNTVCPGAICTEGMGKARADGSSSMDPTRRRIPTGRRGHAHEVANAILFLASQQASYINGTELIVDGGLFSSLSAYDPNRPTLNVPNDPDPRT